MGQFEMTVTFSQIQAPAMDKLQMLARERTNFHTSPAKTAERTRVMWGQTIPEKSACQL